MIAPAGVYRSDSPQIAVPWTDRRFWTRAWHGVSPNVWFLGITSLLTDVSSEMVASVLPMYLVLQLNLSPLAFGALDGLYNGVSALTRWASGIAADRWQRHKEVAFAGYALSAACRLALIAAGRSPMALGAAIAADRLGKGIRTAPRDALISLSSDPARLAHSFGIHRALDATGAMLGPIAAFAVLAQIPRGFDVVFVTSFSVAIIGLGVLALFVHNAPPPASSGRGPGPFGPGTGAAPERTPSLRDAIGLLRQPGFRRITMAASALALLTVSDAFVYLVVQERTAFSAGLFPLLYVGTSLSYLLLAVPCGVFADRLGRSRMFVAGHLLLLVLYGLLLFAGTHPALALAAVVLLGAYYAATDGVLAALASGLLPPGLRGSGLALLATATSLARLGASIVFGAVWTLRGRDAAMIVFGVALAIGVAAAAIALRRRDWAAQPG